MAGPNEIKLMYRTQLPSFAAFAFGIVNPHEEFIDNWHIDVTCFALSQILKGENTRLIINLPPRALKSFLTSVCFPAFALAKDPTLKILVLSGSRELTKDLRRKATTLMRSPRYRSVFDHIRVQSGQNELILPQGGELHFANYGQSIIGRGFDLIIVDDPQTPNQAKDPNARKETNAYFTSSVIPRLNNGSKGKIILLQQRLHRDDLTGSLWGHKEPWTKLMIPAVITEDTTWQHANGEHTIRKGATICHRRNSKEDLKTLLRELGAGEFSAQFMQRPVSENYRGDRYCANAWARPPEGWDPDTGMCDYALLWIDETDILERGLFGGPPPFYTLIDPNTSDAEWERQIEIQQFVLSQTATPNIFPPNERLTQDEIDVIWAEASKNNVQFPWDEDTDKKLEDA